MEEEEEKEKVEEEEEKEKVDEEEGKIEEEEKEEKDALKPEKEMLCREWEFFIAGEKPFLFLFLFLFPFLFLFLFLFPFLFLFLSLSFCPLPPRFFFIAKSFVLFLIFISTALSTVIPGNTSQKPLNLLPLPNFLALELTHSPQFCLRLLTKERRQWIYGLEKLTTSVWRLERPGVDLFMSNWRI